MSKYPIGIGFLTAATPERLRYMAQMGATHVVTSLPADGRRNRKGDVWAFEGMLAQRKEIESYGLELSVYEGIPVPERVKLGQQGRDEDIENYCESIRNMRPCGRAHPLLQLDGRLWLAAHRFFDAGQRRCGGDDLST